MRRRFTAALRRFTLRLWSHDTTFRISGADLYRQETMMDQEYWQEVIFSFPSGLAVIAELQVVTTRSSEIAAMGSVQ